MELVDNVTLKNGLMSSLAPFLLLASWDIEATVGAGADCHKIKAIY